MTHYRINKANDKILCKGSTLKQAADELISILGGGVAMACPKYVMVEFEGRDHIIWAK